MTPIKWTRISYLVGGSFYRPALHPPDKGCEILDGECADILSYGAARGAGRVMEISSSKGCNLKTGLCSTLLFVFYNST